jgi:hypothetical protein
VPEKNENPKWQKAMNSWLGWWSGLAKGKRGQNVVLSPDAFITANDD